MTIQEATLIARKGHVIYHRDPENPKAVCYFYRDGKDGTRLGIFVDFEEDFEGDRISYLTESRELLDRLAAEADGWEQASPEKEAEVLAGRDED